MRSCAGYLERFCPEFATVFVDAKVRHKRAADGPRQVRDYAKNLASKFVRAASATDLSGAV